MFLDSNVTSNLLFCIEIFCNVFKIETFAAKLVDFNFEELTFKTFKEL